MSECIEAKFCENLTYEAINLKVISLTPMFFDVITILNTYLGKLD